MPDTVMGPPTPSDTARKFPGDPIGAAAAHGNGGGGGGGGGGTGGVTVPAGALSSDPQYQITSSYLNANQALDAADLQRMIDTANARFGLSSQEIANSLQNAQRNVTYDLANRQATESGDNAFYHNQAALLASFQQQGAQIDLQDYLAGAQAAFAHQSLSTQSGLSQAWLDAYQNEVNYYTQLAGGGAPVAPPPPAPGGASG